MKFAFGVLVFFAVSGNPFSSLFRTFGIFVILAFSHVILLQQLLPLIHRLHFSVAARLLSTKLVAGEGQHLGAKSAKRVVARWCGGLSFLGRLKAAGFVFPIELTPGRMTWMTSIKSRDEIYENEAWKLMDLGQGQFSVV